MAEWLTQANAAVNGIVWGPAGAALLLGTGLWMTVCTGAFQFVHVGHWLRQTVGAILADREVTARPNTPEHGISQFQSMCTALAGTLGTGNIVGVATAIVGGGPGAVFWMWVMALFGMAVSFAENILGVYYRHKNTTGGWQGGAMFYLADGLGAKPGCRRLGRALGMLFACFCAIASFGIGNMSQTNAVAGSLQAAFGTPPPVTGAVLLVLTLLITLGGLTSVACVTEKLVPFMALFYIAGALTLLALNAQSIPAAFAAILRGAFCPRAAGGGAVGYGIAQAMEWGFKRGAFSNEAGLGSSVLVNACANVSEPVQQGMWGIFEVFTDTLVMCTLTALVILTSGVIDLRTGYAAAGASPGAMVGDAFGAVFGRVGEQFIAISVLLFAYSTVLGWSHYGSAAVTYLLGPQAVPAYRLIFACMTAVGAVMRLDLAWALSDTFNGLMMLPNLVGILALSSTVKTITKNYVQRRLHNAPAASVRPVSGPV